MFLILVTSAQLRSTLGSSTAVAPTFMASSRRVFTGSTPMTCAAPMIRAPCTALRPTGPSPKTATFDPGSTGDSVIVMPRPQPPTQCSMARSIEGAVVKTGMTALPRHHVLGQAADVSRLHDLAAVGGRRDRYGLLASAELAAVGAAAQALVALAALGRDRDDHAVADLDAPHLGPDGNDGPTPPCP